MCPASASPAVPGALALRKARNSLPPHLHSGRPLPPGPAGLCQLRSPPLLAAATHPCTPRREARGQAIPLSPHQELSCTPALGSLVPLHCGRKGPQDQIKFRSFPTRSRQRALPRGEVRVLKPNRNSCHRSEADPPKRAPGRPILTEQGLGPWLAAVLHSQAEKKPHRVSAQLSEPEQMRDHRQRAGPAHGAPGSWWQVQRAPALHMMLHTVGPGHPAASYPGKSSPAAPGSWQPRAAMSKPGQVTAVRFRAHGGPAPRPRSPGLLGAPAAPGGGSEGAARHVCQLSQGGGGGGGNKSCAEAEQRELGWWGGAWTERRWRCGAGLLPGWHSKCALLGSSQAHGRPSSGPTLPTACLRGRGAPLHLLTGGLAPLPWKQTLMAASRRG